MTTQHLGIVLLNGVPYNVRKQYPRGDEGYFFSSCVSRNFIAVTGAVMLTRASHVSGSWRVHRSSPYELQ